MQWLHQGGKLENRNYLDKTTKKVTMTDGTAVIEQNLKVYSTTLRHFVLEK